MQSFQLISAVTLLFIFSAALVSCADQRDRRSHWNQMQVAPHQQLSDPRKPPKANFGSCNAKDLKEFTCD